MKILVADDDFDFRLALDTLLPRWGFDIINANDGVEAWQVLQGPNAPRLALLDWMMPGLDGLEVCRLARDHPATASTYLMLLTARTAREDLVNALNSGADEFLVKPLELGELRGRLFAARRVVELQERLTEQADQLRRARAQIQQLRRLLPFCLSCGKARPDAPGREQVETYLASLGHPLPPEGLCPECRARAAGAGSEPRGNGHTGL